MSQATAGSSTERQTNRTQDSKQVKSSAESCKGEDFYDMIDEVSESITKYCSNRPRVAALALISVGFFLGWKIKPW